MWAVYSDCLEGLLAEADLPGAPPAPESARLLTALVHGVQLIWAAQPRGDLREELAGHLGTVLEGWRRRP